MPVNQPNSRLIARMSWPGTFIDSSPSWTKRLRPLGVKETPACETETVPPTHKPPCFRLNRAIAESASAGTTPDGAAFGTNAFASFRIIAVVWPGHIDNNLARGAALPELL